MSKFGIDTSHWQGDFDYALAQQTDGIEFAILKCGGADGGLYQDEQFINSYNKCNDAGIPIGAYFYGNAYSTEDAINEARFCTQLLEGKDFTYPIFYDIEGAMLTGGDLTEIGLAFCNELKSYGHDKVGIYTSQSQFNSYFDVNRLKDEGCYLWCARYSDVEPEIGVDVDIWQFGGGTNFIRDTQINGVTVDQNYCYTDFMASSDDGREWSREQATAVTNALYNGLLYRGYNEGENEGVVHGLEYDWSRIDAFDNIRGSEEHAKKQLIVDCYLVMRGSIPSYDEIEFWFAQDEDSIKNGILYSEEFNNNYGV